MIRKTNEEIPASGDDGNDPQIDDTELRALLALCFPRSSEAFLERGYLFEAPEERCVIRDVDERIIAHAAIRERPLRSGDNWFTVAGISEVCVHPDHRKNGLAKRILAATHQRILARGLLVSLLFGQEEVYASSGYRRVDNVFRFWDPLQLAWKQERIPSALVREFDDALWPSEDLQLNGVLY